ncbi:MAG TPA: caspase family protein, partial [Gemmata sp.]|nr:caspase family protein [Gemmata sp.]
MKSRVLGFVAIATSLLVGANRPVRADEPSVKAAGPFVVIVGVGQFQDKAIDPRPTADNDAKALFDVLSDPKYLGVPAERAKLLISTPDEKRGGQVATREAIVKAIEAATAQTGKDDLIVLAFFGRGASANDQTAFFTPDAVLKDRGKTALLFGTDLDGAFKKLKGQKVLLLMDVQYKGFKLDGDEKVAEPTLTDVDGLLFGKDEKEESVRPADRLMLLSGFINSAPVVRGEMGLFASTVSEALKGAADTPPNNEGYEPDGLVTTDELIKYLETEIPKQARILGKTDKEKEAQALPLGARTSHFVVTRNPTATDRVKKRIEALDVLAKAGTVNEELAREGTALLSRMPKLKANQELRKQYQQLVDGTLKSDAFVAARNEIKEGQKLDPKDAENFAKKVHDAIDIVTRTYVKEVDAGDLTAAAIKGMYRRIEEHLPADLEETIKSLKAIPDDRRMAILKDARIRLGRREDLEGNKDADVSILMMMASLNDPYTVYFDEDAVRRIASALRGRFPGVGIQIRRDAVHDALLVVSPIKGSPAFAAGIQAGDLIVRVVRSVDAKTGAPLPADTQREFSTKGMKIDEAIALITGKPGSPVTLIVERDGKEMTFALKRNWVSVETVLGVKRDSVAEWDFLIDSQSKIGYVRLTQ